jgi:hypothetical protein
MSADATIDPNAMYPIRIAAHLLSISPSSLRDLERRGKVACTRTLGGQRRFAGSELLRLLTPPTAGRAEKPDPASARGARAVADSAARQAWLASIIAKAQREVPAHAPADIRLRLATDLERALHHFGPAAPTGDVEPLVKSLVEPG